MHIPRGRVLALLKDTRDGTDVSDAGLRVDPTDRDALTRWIRSTTTPQRVVMRSIVVLLAAGGWSNSKISMELGVSRRTVALWKERYRVGGAKSVLADAPGRGRKPGRDAQVVSRILATTQQTPPSGERWTVRTMARTVGVSHATVQRVWREHGIVSSTSQA